MKSKKTLTVLLIVLGLAGFMLTACNGTKDSSDDDSSSDSESSEEPGINDKVKLDDYVVMVADIEDPYVETNEFLQPDEGNRYVAVEVVYENQTDDESLDYNVYDWTLYDSEGYSYDPSFAAKDPDLGSGNVNAGDKVRGWITFEVGEDAEDFKIQFAPSWISDDNVEIKLY